MTAAQLSAVVASLVFASLAVLNAALGSSPWLTAGLVLLSALALLTILGMLTADVRADRAADRPLSPPSQPPGL
jgi:hypothetical protein